MTETTASSKPKVVLHAVLVNIDGVGVLITGEAGTGKSECALDLITRHGHQLVADDVVEVSQTGGVLVGSCASGMEGILNVRDLGILDVSHAASVREQRIDLIIQFEAGPDGRNEAVPVTNEYEVLGVSVPRVVIHNCRTRNLSLLVETAARRSGTAGGGIESDFLRRYDSDLLHG